MDRMPKSFVHLDLCKTLYHAWSLKWSFLVLPAGILASVHRTIECKLLAHCHFGRIETNKKLPRTCASLRGVCNQSVSSLLHWHPLLRWLVIRTAKKCIPSIEINSKLNQFDLICFQSFLASVWDSMLNISLAADGSWQSDAAFLRQAAKFQETGQKPWNRPAEVGGKGNPNGTWLGNVRDLDSPRNMFTSSWIQNEEKCEKCQTISNEERSDEIVRSAQRECCCRLLLISSQAP